MSTSAIYDDKLKFTLIKLPDAERQNCVSFIRKTTPDYLLEISGLNIMCEYPSSEGSNGETISFPEPLDCSFLLNYGDLFLCVVNGIEQRDFLNACVTTLFFEALEKRNASNDTVRQFFDGTKKHRILTGEIEKANSEYKKTFSALAFAAYISLVLHEDVKLEGLFSAAIQNLLTDKNPLEYGPINSEQLQSNLDNNNLFSEITMTITYRSNGEEEYSFQSLFDLIGFEVRQLKGTFCCIKECENCGRLFIPANRSDEKYCNFLFDGIKTCKQSAFSARLDRDEILKTYRKIYKTQNARKQRNSHRQSIAERFDEWAKYAKGKLDECQNGKISLDQMVEEISSASWMDK